MHVGAGMSGHRARSAGMHVTGTPGRARGARPSYLWNRASPRVSATCEGGGHDEDGGHFTSRERDSQSLGFVGGDGLSMGNARKDGLTAPPAPSAFRWRGVGSHQTNPPTAPNPQATPEPPTRDVTHAVNPPPRVQKHVYREHAVCGVLPPGRAPRDRP